MELKLAFTDLMLHCKQRITEGMDHIYYNTYSELLDEEWNEVVSTQLNILSDINSPNAGNANVNPSHYVIDDFVFDLTFNVAVYKNGILINCIYKPDSIDKSQIAGLCQIFNVLIEKDIKFPNIKMRDWDKVN